MGVSIDTDILQRLANSVSNKAELVISGKKATLIIPSKDAPIIGNYVITRVIRIKASDVKGLDVRQLVNEMIAEAKQLSSQEGIPLDQAFLKAGERAAAKIQQLASKIKDPKAKQELLARAKLVEELAQKLAQSSDYAKQLGGARIVVNVGADGTVYTAVVMSTTSGAAQSTQQAQQTAQATQTQAKLVNTAVTTIERLKSKGITQVSVQSLAEELGISLSQAQTILPQVISRLGLKTVQVPIEVPLTQTFVKEVPREVTITVPQSLSVTKTLREVVVPIEIPKPKTITREVNVPITIEQLMSATINKPLRLVEVEVDIPVPKTIVKEVPKVITLDELLGLTVTKPLKEVVIPVDIPRLKTVTIEVPKEIILEDYTSASVTGRVVEIPVPKTVQVVVPYYEVVDVPVNINSNPPQPQPSPPGKPVPVPPTMLPPLPGVNYGQLPPGTFKPPKRKRQEEVVMI